MRTIRLLATSLLVALSMGVSSCGDDELEVNPPTTSGGETSLELICKEYGITDYKDIDLLNYFIHANNTIINKEQANFTGLRIIICGLLLTIIRLKRNWQRVHVALSFNIHAKSLKSLKDIRR